MRIGVFASEAAHLTASLRGLDGMHDNPGYDEAAGRSNCSRKTEIENSQLENADLRHGRERRKVTKIAFRTAWKSMRGLEPVQNPSVMPVK